MVGSIGGGVAHYDYSKALEKRGGVVTLIYAGDHKFDTNPYQPLPGSVQKKLQTKIDRIYKMFVDTVARHLKVSADYKSTHAELARSGFEARAFPCRCSTEWRHTDS